MATFSAGDDGSDMEAETKIKISAVHGNSKFSVVKKQTVNINTLVI